jgi:hypothetical protein
MHTNQAVNHGTRDPMRSPNVMRWLSARSGLSRDDYPGESVLFCQRRRQLDTERHRRERR